MERPLILITNDDGVSYAGIKALAQVASQYADVVVVAPDGSYSGKSHSITVLDELRVRQANDEVPGCLACYAVTGTPVDCVKIGIFALSPRRPDLVLSGINHGSNTSTSVHYSGTVGAAREGAIDGIRSCAFSYDDCGVDADFSEAVKVADALIPKLLDNSLSGSLLYNVNVPKGKVKGLRAARMALGHWIEQPIKFVPPFGPDAIYWLDGSFCNDHPEAQDTDEALLADGFASITPILIDVTDNQAMCSCPSFDL